MRTAIYLRISSEDADLRTGEKDESESISNQRSLLREYVSSHAELSNSEILEFCDDGWSGTNFERPAVKELLEQVKRGQINCILVKDLSRLAVIISPWETTFPACSRSWVCASFPSTTVLTAAIRWTLTASIPHFGR